MRIGTIYQEITTWCREIKQDKYFVLLILFLCLLLPLIPRYIIAPWDNFRFIFAAILPGIVFGYSLFNKDEICLRLNYLDFGWLIFLSLSFLSFTWATNGSLVWYPAFGWVTIVLWMFMFRFLWKRPIVKNNLQLLFLLLFLIIITHVVVVFFLGKLAFIDNWNFHFGYNWNYVSSLLVILFPFLLYFENKIYINFINFIKLIVLIFISYVLFKTQARGATIAFLTILIFYILSIYRKEKLILLLFTFIIIIIGISFFFFFFLFPDEFTSLVILTKESGSVGNSHRLQMLLSSLEIFFNYPLKGVGFGNWRIFAYMKDYSEISGFNDSSYFFRPGNHNIFSQHLSELGILGLSAFLLPIISAFYSNMQEGKNIEKIASIVILVYLILSLFYRDSNLYEFHFSGIQLIAFCMLGILTCNNNFFVILKRGGFYIILFSSIFCFVWFVYYKWTYDLHLKAMKSFYTMKTVLIDNYDSHIETRRQPGNNAEAIAILETIYNPIFKTTHGYSEGGIGYNNSLSLQLAMLYQKQEKFKEAELYYKKAFEDAPFNELVLIRYSKFLLRVLGDVQNAKILANRIYGTQKNNYDINLLKAEIALVEKEFEQAKIYLEEFDEKKGQIHSTGFLAILLKAEIALAKKKYPQAQEYLNILQENNHPYTNLIKNFQTRLSEATQVK